MTTESTTGNAPTPAATSKQPGRGFLQHIRPHRPAVKPSQTSAEKEKITSLLEKDTVTTGDMDIQDGIMLKGTLNGNLRVKNMDALVYVDLSATVNGGIIAGRVYVKGKVKGSIRAKNIVLQSSAFVDGDIFYESIQIAEGAEFTGRVQKQPMHDLSPQPVASSDNSRVVSIS